MVQHLRRGHSLSSEEYYLKYISNEIGKCELCGNKTNFRSLTAGYRKYCSKKCSSVVGGRTIANIILNLSPEDALKRNENISNKHHIKPKKEKQEIKDKRAKTNLEKYGNEIPSKLASVRDQISETKQNHTPERKKEIQEKRVETTMDRYGVDHVFKTTQFAEKAEQTKLEKYGDVNYNNRKKCKETLKEKYGDENYVNIEKIKETNLERYGLEYFVNPEKTKKTKLERYGDEQYNNRPLVKKTKLENHGDENYNNRDKFKQTNLEKYGVEHSMQNSDVFDKSQKAAFNAKSYKLPSGKEIMLRGYEPIAMDILLKEHNETDLITGKNIPRIWYQLNGKKHKYYPDIFIKSENKIIEVKSPYTMMRDPDKINAKCKAVIDHGHSMEIWVLDKSGIILDKIIY